MIKNDARLPLVQSRKEFLEYLEDIISMSREDDEEPRGRPRELKAYMLESEGGFPPSFFSDRITGEVQSTGLDGIKILQVSQNENILEFFLDTSDPRFFVLHTNEKSDDVRSVVETLTKDRRYTFDNTWFHSNMLYEFTQKNGNTFDGFGVKYDNNTFSIDDGGNSDIDDLGITINGSLAPRVLDIVENEPRIAKAMAFNKVRIRRGQDPTSGFIQDDLTYDGYLAVKRGKSVQDHLQLIDICRDEYSKTIKHIEESSLGVRTIDERTLVEGKSFDFEFKNTIENLDLFIERVFNSSDPFKLWGLKSIIRDDYYKITAVDLHAGAPINFEITGNFMRAYLSKGNCGNTILRLLTNLQIYYDSKVTCKQIVR